MGVKMLAMGNLELEHLKDGFTSLVSQAKPAILPAFLLWLDIKLSEYKVHGYMFSDPENTREGPWLQYALEVLCKYNPSLVSGLSVPENSSLQNGATTPNLPTTPTDSHIPAKKRGSYLGFDVSQSAFPKMPEEVASMNSAYAAVKHHKRKHQSSTESDDAVMDLSVSHLVSNSGQLHNHNGSSMSHQQSSSTSYHNAPSDYGSTPVSYTQSPFSTGSSSPLAQSSPSKMSCRTPPKKRRDRATLHSTMRDLLTRPSNTSSPLTIIEKSVMKELFTQQQHPQPDADMTTHTVYTARSIMDESPLSLMKEVATGGSSVKVPVLHPKTEPQSGDSKLPHEDPLTISSGALTGEEVEQQFADKADKNVTSALRELLNAKLSLPPQDQDSCNTMLKSDSSSHTEMFDQSVPSPTVPRDDHAMSSNDILSDDSINRTSPDHAYDVDQMQQPLSIKSENQLENDKTMMDKFKTSGQQCKECGQIFHYRSSFRRHMKVHQGIFSHVCAVCGRKFTRKEHFVRHKCSRRPNKASRGAASQIENSEGTSPKVEYPPILDDENYLPHGMDSPISQHDSTLEDACYSEISVDFADSPCSVNGSNTAPSLCGESRRKNKAPRRVIAIEDEELGQDEFSIKVGKKHEQKKSSYRDEEDEHDDMELGGSCSPCDEGRIDAEFGEDERGTCNVDPFHHQEQPCLQGDMPTDAVEEGVGQDEAGDANSQGGRMFTIDTGSYKVLTEDSTEASNKCIKVVKQGNYLRLKDEAQMIGGQLCFVCPVCKKIFHRSSNFSRHMRIHRGVYSYVCHTCVRGFFRKEHFQKHKCSRRGMSHISERKTKLEMDVDFPNIDRTVNPQENQTLDEGEREMGGGHSDEELPPGAEEGIYLGDVADQNLEDASEEIYSDEDENRLTIVTDEAPSEL